tara:strand:+ start:71 stop:496 length:426 start_codon:yes stop_codon:yes gene_type:complete
MENGKVVKVSFLVGDERRVLVPNERSGKICLNTSTLGLTNRFYSVYDFVNHEKIRDRDPVITLSNGEKMRVFKGGDPSYMMAQTEGVMRKHEQVSTTRKKIVDKVKVKTKKKDYGLDNKTVDDYNSYGYDDYPFDDYDDVF